jgi:D-alanine-D-alanine ligase
MNVLVIYGGDSSERDISLISGANVAEGLTAAKHVVTFFDPASGPHTLSDALKGIDVVFPILHGTGGEDGFIQRALELENAVYVGSNSEVSATCFDKWQTIQKAKQTVFPATELVSRESIRQSSLLNKPYVVKPRAEGSSVDTFLVRDPKDFDLAKLEEIFDKYNDELMIEELIEGQEITVAVLDNEPLPVVEIIPPAGQNFDFSNKYNGATAENCPPKFVGEDLQLQAQEMALNLHATMECQGFSRTDMIIDKKGNIFVLEINTLPGMTPESLFPRAAKAAGITLPELVDSLVTQALRYNTKR